MKKVITLISLASLTLIYSCQKKKEFKNEDGQASEDNQAIQAQADEAMNDANGEVAKVNNMTGKKPFKLDGTILASTPCGLTVDTNGAYQGSITLNYTGISCNNRKRTGSIKLTIQDYANGTRWNDAGCVLQIDYIGYKVTRTSDGKSIEFNGTHYLTNESGGNAIALVLGFQSNLVHSVTGTSLSVKFSDGSNASWNIHRRVTYTYASQPSAVITAKCEGIGSYNGVSNLENWGTTRKGDEFTSQVTVPVVWNTTCGPNAPVEGQLVIKVDSKEFELKCTLGVDSSGNPVPVSYNNCPYGMKVEWSHKNKNKDKIIAYK